MMFNHLFSQEPQVQQPQLPMTEDVSASINTQAHQNNHPVAYHSEVLLLYFGCGLFFLLLVFWKARHWKFWISIPLLACLASGIVSFNQVPDYETYAPTLIAILLELEKEQRLLLNDYLMQLGVITALFMLLGFSIRFAWKKFYKHSKKKSDDEPTSSENKDATDEASVSAHSS